MEYEFDKEIDSLLRQARPETAVSESFNAHVDADEISLFAENALTQKARMRVTEHLADCAKCRKILSNVIALNAEAASEIVHTEETKPIVLKGAIPWYRKILAFPRLAYTMGGLTVLLAGMIVYVVLQSYNESKTTSLAQMEKSVERPRGASGASSEGDSITVETYSNTANAAATNASNAATTTANSATNTASAKPNSPIVSANSNTAILSAPKDQPAIAQAAPTPAVGGSNLAERERSTEDKTATADAGISIDGVDRAGAQPNYRQSQVTRNQSITPDSKSVESRQIQSLPMTTQAPRVAQAAPPQEADDSPKARVVKKETSEKTKSVSGKDFVYKDNVWYDKSYRQQKTTNVSRNSGDYKKLDSGLRSVADNLGGTVVIVWDGKAYRIQ